MIEFSWLRTADILKRGNPFPDTAMDEELLGNLSGYWLVKNLDEWRWLWKKKIRYRNISCPN